MKTVIKEKELKKVILDSIDLMCDAVSSTLGPTGNNVLINTDESSPYITNDGVTIARSIESDDKKINTVLEIIKEASLKTDEIVGDGTTTTLVLLQSIYKEGLKEIEKGKNPIILKRELEIELENIINQINDMKKKPTKKDLLSIATISSNDEEIGLILSEVYHKMKNSYSINIEESNTEKTYYEIKKGYSIDIDISPLYFNNNKEIILNNSYILLLRGYLDNLEQISNIINDSIKTNKNIIIFAYEINQLVKQEMLMYNIKENKNIYLFELPDYASRKEMIVKDLSLICNSNVKDLDYDKLYFNDLGYIKQCIIKQDEIIIINDNKNINKQINKLKQELEITYDDYEKEFIKNRISKLENGQATIYVGGITKTEKKEKKMRYIDALCAIEEATKGIVLGEGITFLKISNNLNNKVLKNSLKIPFQKIMINAGIDYKLIENDVLNNKIYNFNTNKLEDINNTTIIDPKNVLIEAIKNAVSIASILLTTNYLVINENLKNDIEL